MTWPQACPRIRSVAWPGSLPVKVAGGRPARCLPVLLPAFARLMHVSPLVLQVHDEVILEGPREHAEAARQRVIECMRSPFNASTPKPLLVDLAVDCKSADTWYEAK